MECLLPYLCMVTVPHILVGLEGMLDYGVVRLERFHCTSVGDENCATITQSQVIIHSRSSSSNVATPTQVIIGSKYRMKVVEGQSDVLFFGATCQLTSLRLQHE